MNKASRKISIKTIFTIIIGITLLLEAIGYTCIGILFPKVSAIRTTATELTESLNYATQFDKGSQMLTLCAHNYVANGDDIGYFVDYWEYRNERQLREEAYKNITENGISLTDEEKALIDEARDISDALVKDEEVAMLCMIKKSALSKGLTADAVDATYILSLVKEYNANLPDGKSTCTWVTEDTCNEIIEIENTDNWTNAVSDAGLNSKSTYDADDLQTIAENLLFGSAYNESCMTIYSDIQAFSNSISERGTEALSDSVSVSTTVLIVLIVLLAVVMLFIGATVVILEKTLIRPLIKLNRQLETNAAACSLSGIQEINNISLKYNSTKETLSATNKELALQAKIYKEQSRRDFLTHLANREMLDEYLAEMFKGDIVPIIVYMLDVDDFKKVNDTYGHEVGDEVLKALGRVFKEIGKEHDGIAARYGGEEFVICATGVTENDVDVIADEILEKVRAVRIVHGEQIIRVTASIGSCFSFTGGTDAQTILRNADGAMYKSKARGKNRHSRFKNIIT